MEIKKRGRPATKNVHQNMPPQRVNFDNLTTLDELDSLIEDLTSTYDIMYNKIFVLHVNFQIIKEA